MRLLIIEDEPLLRQQLDELLGKQGYALDATSDGLEGEFLAIENDYDLAIIDLGLPKLDGMSIIRSLRKHGKSYPVLILTARQSWQDKVAGLEAGADDYLVKPFHPEELRVRVHALLRRASGNSQSVLDYGVLKINTLSKTVVMEEAQVELTQYEYNTLEYLALHANQVVSKTTLTEHLYQQDFDRDSNVIEVFIGRLRKKLDPKGNHKPIATVRGLGYRFEMTAQP